MSLRRHTATNVITGVDGAPVPMPQSLLLRRLSFAFVSAVESFTNFLLACESHIPPSPRTPRPSRKRSLPMPPGSPTSVKCHVRSPISLLDVEHHVPRPLSEDKSTSRRSRMFRSQNPTFACTNTTSRRRPKPKSSSKPDKLSRNPSRLPRRATYPRNPDAQTQPHQRQGKRLRPVVRRTQDPRQSSNERLAFVQPPMSRLPGANAWRRHRDTIHRISSSRPQKRIHSEPRVAPIALPPTIRQVPRGTLTSFLTSEESTLPLELSKRLDTMNTKEALLGQGIRPSRKVRFAQNVQLVC